MSRVATPPEAVAPPAAMAAMALRASGVDPADLGTGETDVPTPAHLAEAAHAARAGETRHAPAAGATVPLLPAKAA